MLRLRTAGPFERRPGTPPGPTDSAGSRVFLWSVSYPADLTGSSEHVHVYSPLCVHTCVCMGDEQVEKQKGAANICHPATVSNSQYPAFSHRGDMICNIPETPECKGGQFLVSRGSKDGS